LGPGGCINHPKASGSKGDSLALPDALLVWAAVNDGCDRLVDSLREKVVINMGKSRNSAHFLATFP
jgi:hypothetical protein